ncbi:zinc-dependent alcohol dehydrogenase [Blastococcus deserti]|uniref:Zinc-binding alcohol dehydrogenase n=1 Tax=Blastococcus deserti TaxID=2259033 RepID=A0ABW4X6E0_9ACTN
MTECRSLGVRAPYEPAIFDSALPEVPAGGASVRTLYSGVSAGTELAYVKGTDPAFTARRDPDLGVFVPGAGSRRYPLRAMGYMEVAEVVDSRRPDLPVGGLVAAAYGHRSHHVLAPQDVVVPVPADLDPVLAIYLAQMGPICANGLLHATAEFGGTAASALGDGVRGRTVLVTGAGVVGLLTALFAAHHGAGDVAVADPDLARRATATALGLQAVDADSAWRWCKDRWVHGPGDRGADLVFQCRGRAAVLHEALRSLRPQGAVIDLAFYQDGGSELRLGEEFHHNGLTIRCAQIARVPRGFAGSWDRYRLAGETADLLVAHGAALRRHVVTDVVPVDEGPSVLLALARRERAAGQVVLSFPGRPTSRAG